MPERGSNNATPHICPICNCSLSPWLQIPGDFRRSQDKTTYHLYRCNNCQFGQLLPTPTNPQLQSFYQLDTYYTHQNYDADKRPLSFTEKLRAHIAWRFDYSKELDQHRFKQLKDTGLSSCCDVGCGGGGSLSRLRDAGFTNLIGIDPDPDALATAQAQGFKTYQGTAENLPPEISNQQFDLVLLTHVLEHTPDPIAALTHLKPLLSPASLLIVEVPNNQNLGLKTQGKAWPWLDVPRHLNFFTRKSLTALCHKTNYQIIDFEYRGYCRQFQSNWLDYEDQIQKHQLNTSPSTTTYLTRWHRLFRTILTNNDAKYDSIRVLLKSNTT